MSRKDEILTELRAIDRERRESNARFLARAAELRTELSDVGVLPAASVEVAPPGDPREAAAEPPIGFHPNPNAAPQILLPAEFRTDGGTLHGATRIPAGGMLYGTTLGPVGSGSVADDVDAAPDTIGFHPRVGHSVDGARPELLNVDSGTLKSAAPAPTGAEVPTNQPSDPATSEGLGTE